MYYICIMNDPFVEKWKSQVKKGILTFMILNILKGKELYGYEIIEDVYGNSKIKIADGTLYPLMNRLKKEGLVSSKWVEQESGIPRKYYCLTKKGKVTLSKMKPYWLELEQSIKKILK